MPEEKINADNLYGIKKLSPEPLVSVETSSGVSGAVEVPFFFTAFGMPGLD